MLFLGIDQHAHQLTVSLRDQEEDVILAIQFLKEENRILRARLPVQVHIRPEERERRIKFGRIIGRAIEELITIVSPATFYRWLREEGQPKRKKNPKGGQRKPREIRELVLQIASVTGFGYTKICSYSPPLR